jgi:transposase
MEGEHTTPTPACPSCGGDAQVKPHEPPKSCNTKWPRRDWRRLDERIEQVTKEIDVLAHGSESCRQLMTVPGIGPLIASAMVAAVANGAAFAKGRDFAAWLGLVPKQMSTGDRTILGRISKRGNRYARCSCRAPA